MKTEQAVKGFISPSVCLDGEDTHEWEEDEMPEDGMKFKITVCRKCGYWM